MKFSKLSSKQVIIFKWLVFSKLAIIPAYSQKAIDDPMYNQVAATVPNHWKLEEELEKMVVKYHVQDTTRKHGRWESHHGMDYCIRWKFQLIS